MNLPNKLTISRIVMIPLFVVAFYLTQIPANFYISAGIFAIAAGTDFLDGYIARKYNLVTSFGKFLDPIADKVLVSTALIIMLVPPMGIVIVPWYASIMVAVILARELIVSGFRLVAAGKNVVIAADKSGKIKTFLTDVAIVVMLVGAQITPYKFDEINIIATVLLALSTLLTITSGVECIVKNASVLSDKTEETPKKEDCEREPIEKTELFKKAVQYSIENGTVGLSFLQRRLSIGYPKAGVIFDKMEELGYTEKVENQKTRKVVITQEQFDEIFGQDN